MFIVEGISCDQGNFSGKAILKICIISKYPPIEGGVSARVYWLAKALGERKHEIHIVTNAQEVEGEYKERFDDDEQEYIPKNVYLHSTNPDTNPWHIPFSKAYGMSRSKSSVNRGRNHNSKGTRKCN